MKDHKRVNQDGNKSGLRLANLAGDSMLYEISLSDGRIGENKVKLIISQLQDIVKEMKREWATNPDSPELNRGFDLLNRLVEYLKKP